MLSDSKPDAELFVHVRQPVSMDCATTQEVLSSHLDQEAELSKVASANGHLGTCTNCRAWWAVIGQVNRLLRVRHAEVIPDLATAALARSRPRRVGHRRWIRLTLTIVALTELTIALPRWLAGQGAQTVHDARHVSAVGAALAIGLLYVAWRPMRAFGTLPIITAFAMTMTFATIVNIATGRTTSMAEAHHLVEIAGLALVWALAGFPLPRRLDQARMRLTARRRPDLHHA